jgi:indole-3-glycerol phosphate synthase
MSFLNNILAAKHEEITAAKARLPQARLEWQASARRDYRGFTAALAQPGVRIVAEIKRASPSLGMIRPNLDPAALARSYAEGAAAAISVLTEPAFFKGSVADLHQARAAADLPVLRKDFIIDPYQVYETAAMGADAMLLIVRILDDERLHTLYTLARSLGLDVLTEIYDEQDAARAHALGATLVGINNRDLAQFKTDITQATRLASLLPPDTLTVALSGIHSADDIRQTLAGGIRRFLIGEALVRQDDPAATLREWTAIVPEAAPPTPHASRLTPHVSRLTPHASQLKICGITSRATAQFCAELGVGALGAVFYEKSPRHVSPAQARALFDGLPRRVARVGVFVDRPVDELLAIAREAALDTVQLHGHEPVETILAVQQAGFHVIKVLKVTGGQLLQAAQALPRDCGILVECGQGTLPGGNGAAWNWMDAEPLAGVRPFALAGGLTPDNLLEAIRLSRAVAWDVSSGVERSPGVKDHEAITRLMDALGRYLRELTPAPQNMLFWAGDIRSQDAAPQP